MSKRVCGALIVLLSVVWPAIANALGYTDFNIFGIDEKGKSLVFWPSEVAYLTNEGNLINAGCFRESNQEAVGIKVYLDTGGDEGRVFGGRCIVKYDAPFLIECDKIARGLLSGVSYNGYQVSEDNVKTMPEVYSVWKRYIKIMEYGGINSYYICSRNCRPGVPKVLIFVWHGD